MAWKFKKEKIMDNQKDRDLIEFLNMPEEEEKNMEIEKFNPNEILLKLIKEKAHKYWEEDGKPDGEEYIDHKYWGRMKIKDIHWKMAWNAVEGYWAHNAGGDW
jgi:Protein of unknown function (DUF2934)